MLDRSRALEVVEAALKSSSADQMEVLLAEADASLTRFADNVIHQNVAHHDTRVLVRAALGKRIGVATSNSLEPSALKDAATRALSIARVVSESTDFVSLPAPLPVPEVRAFDAETASCSPDRRADAVASLVQDAKKSSTVAAGAFSTSSQSVTVGNSLGLRAFHPFTQVNLNLTMTRGTGTARASSAAWKLTDVDVTGVGREALDRCLAAVDPIDLPPGDYPVVLLPDAVSTLIEYLSYVGFSAKSFQEKRSFMVGNFGKQVTGSNITIWDDGLDGAGIPWPVDFEGVPKRRVTFIDRGVARGVVYDSRTAGKEGKSSTGHAYPADMPWGPLPWNLFMQSGDSSVQEMIASTSRGLLVSYFHYVNVAEPMKTVLTGMTRFGTFLIEDGKVTRPVKNLRFTQSVLDAFSRCSGISRDRQRFESSVVPALKLDSFSFTGKTEF